MKMKHHQSSRKTQWHPAHRSYEYDATSRVGVAPPSVTPNSSGPPAQDGKAEPAYEFTPCSCHGTNENCRRCYGTGILPHGDETHPAAVHPTNPNQVRSAACPDCDWAGTDAELLTHRAARHPEIPVVPLRMHVAHPSSASRTAASLHRKPGRRSSGERQTTSAPQKQVRLLICPICGRHQQAERLRHHVDEVHFSRGNLRPQGFPIGRPKMKGGGGSRPSKTRVSTHAGSNQKRPLRSCPECHAPVREDRIGKHLWRVHGIPAVAASPSMGSSKPQRQSGTASVRARTPRASSASHQEDSHLQHHDSLDASRALDASRDYAHPCRESGRFGTHPSHDDFDDESEP